MDEAFVQLTCPTCRKAWESTPSDLPDIRETFECPSCEATHITAEFMRTGRDLETMKRLS